MLPAGIITIWFGAIIDIPEGWALCDGTLGTPNLQSRFVQGAGDGLAPGDTGGSVVHDHTFTGDGHTHSIPVGSGLGDGVNRSDVTNPGSAVGETDNGSSMPPWRAQAFIMKL